MSSAAGACIKTPVKRRAESAEKESSKKTCVSAINPDTARASNKTPAACVGFEVARLVQLGWASCARRLCLDALRPGVVRKVCGFEEGCVVIEPGAKGESVYYDPAHLEHVEETPPCTALGCENDSSCNSVLIGNGETSDRESDSGISCCDSEHCPTEVQQATSQPPIDREAPSCADAHADVISSATATLTSQSSAQTGTGSPTSTIPVGANLEPNQLDDVAAGRLATDPPGILLVVGECGDGKSSLINRLRDPERSGEAASGLKSRGVTKKITAYVGRPAAGRNVDYLDTPGVGDMDVTPMELLTLIEQELISDDVRSADFIDGVIVTSPVPECRVKLGAQIVKLLVEHGFSGEFKWDNVILVGTKADKASEEEKEFFRSTEIDEDGEPVGIAAQFFANAPKKRGTYVMTSKDDISELQAAIAQLPRMKVRYNAPDPATMAGAFAERLGVSRKHFEDAIKSSREVLQKELDAQFAEREAKMKEEMNQMRIQHQEEVEGQQRAAARQTAAMKRQMEDTIKEQSRVQRQMQASSGKEKEELKQRAEALEESVRQAAADRKQIQRQWEAQMEEREQRLRTLMRQLEDKERQQQRARNYDFGNSSVVVRSCLHTRTRNWGNAHGRGRKCVDCRKEVGR